MVPISPDQAAKRKQEIDSKREYIESLKTGKAFADGTAGMKVENIDIGALEKQLARDEKALEYLAPREGNAAEKRKAKQEYDEAKAYIGSHGLTLADMGKYPKPNDPEKDADYGKAVEKAMTQEVGNPEFTRMCNQLKRAASILEPDNPDLRNVNTCRQDR
jgi:hypothetical protein